MPQLIKPTITKIINKDGKETLSISVEPIVIELNLTITSEGGIAVNNAKAATVVPEEEKVDWAIPSFGGKKIKFGK